MLTSVSRGGENVMGLRHCFGSQPTAPIKLATVSWTRPSLTIFVALKVIIVSLVFRKKVYYTRIINTWCCLSGERRRNDDGLSGLSYKIRLETERNSSPVSLVWTHGAWARLLGKLFTLRLTESGPGDPSAVTGTSGRKLGPARLEAAGPGHFWGGVTGDVMRELRAPLSQLISLKCILNIASQ